jgi:hypothetical protein
MFYYSEVDGLGLMAYSSSETLLKYEAVCTFGRIHWITPSQGKGNIFAM